MSGKIAKIFGLAAERDVTTGKIVFVSAQDGIELDVVEDILNIHMIELGNFCTIDVKNEMPSAYQYEPKGMKNVKVTVDGDKAYVTGVVGTRRFIRGGEFYETEEFGLVVCLDPDQATEERSKHPILISRLASEKRSAFNKACVWGAILDPDLSKDQIDSKDAVSEKLSKLNMSKSVDGFESISDKNLSSDEEGSEPKDRKRLVTGLVSGTNELKAYVTCNLTYPGKDGIVEMSKPKELKVGDWLQIFFSDKDFGKFFPQPPKSQTERFKTAEYSKISGPENYNLRLNGKVPELTIKGLKLSVNHKPGGDINDRYLGIVSDKNKLTPKGPCVVDLEIQRHKLQTSTYNKPQTTWYIVKATRKNEEASRDEKEKENRKSENKKQKKKQDKAPGLKESKKSVENERSSEPGKSKPPMQRSPNIPEMPTQPAFPMSGMPAYPYPLGSLPLPNFAPHFFFPPAVFPHPSAPSSSGPPPIVGQGFKEAEQDLVKKRAFVTSVQKNKTPGPKDMTAWLWLLDDHIPSKYFYSSRNQLEVGHFFQGMFIHQKGPKFVCQTYLNPLGRLMEGSVSQGSIELKVFVSTYFPADETRQFPETYHPFIGKIVDNRSYLPTEFSGKIKIAIKLVCLSGSNKYFWVVKNSFQHKHYQLLHDFYNAWHSPGVAELIFICCKSQYFDLEALYNTPAVGQISAVMHKQQEERNNLEMEKEKKKEPLEKAAKESEERVLNDEEHEGNFALTTVVDGDFVRMTVFPRGENQTFGETKKNVSDKKIYKNLEKLAAYTLYRVELNENGEVVEMKDCKQYFSANEKGHIELSFTSYPEKTLASNIGFGDPIGMPKWLGKVIFNTEDEIPEEKKTWRGLFRLLNDADEFVDNELTKKHGVFLIGVTDAEKSGEMKNNKKTTVYLEEETEEEMEEDEDLDPSLFKTHLENMRKDRIFELYKKLRIVLENNRVVTKLEENGIDVGYILRLHTEN